LRNSHPRRTPGQIERIELLVDCENERSAMIVYCATEPGASGGASHGSRSIALDPETVEVLKAQAARQLADQDEWGDGWTDTGLVFTKGNGEALHLEDVTRYFRQAVKKAMLPTIRLHDLRHTHAPLALRAGIHPKVVSERLGHATVSITLDTYSHAIPAMQEEAAALIAGLVFAGK
jgi:integrase